METLEIIGISGKAGSGKDYIASKFLAPMGYMRFSFAWHFKVWLVGKGHATHEEVFETKPPHIRKLLQEEGTERGRNIYGPDVWCATAAEWLNVMAVENGLTKWVIPDVRFPNEVRFIQEMGGKVMRIEAPKRVAKSALTPEQRQHISETALDTFTDFDGYVYNDPEHSETVARQLQSLMGDGHTPMDESGIWDSFDGAFDRLDSTFDRMDELFNKLWGKRWKHDK